MGKGVVTTCKRQRLLLGTGGKKNVASAVLKEKILENDGKSGRANLGSHVARVIP